MSFLGHGHTNMTTESNATPRAQSVPDAAKSIGIGKSTAWMLVKEGAIRVVRLRGRTLVLKEDLDAFLKSLPSARE